MNRKEYEKMIDTAINEFRGLDINYIGLLVMLKPTGSRAYITQKEVIKAQERINLLRHLKALNLLK